MAYKWKPNASQRKEFAQRMQNEDERKAYEKRKEEKSMYSNWKDKDFIPTKMQYEYALEILSKGRDNISEVVNNACNQVMYGFSCQEKINHCFIHIINSIQRNEKQY